MKNKHKPNRQLWHMPEAEKLATMRKDARISYGVAQPPRTDWRSAPVYTCPELRHRSMRGER